MKTVLTIPAMSCGHCKAAVEKALLDVRDVEEAVVDLDGKTAAVTHRDGVDEGALRSAVDSAGYEVTAVARRT